MTRNKLMVTFDGFTNTRKYPCEVCHEIRHLYFWSLTSPEGSFLLFRDRCIDCAADELSALLIEQLELGQEATA